MNYDELYLLLKNHLSGERTKRYVNLISQFHRIQASHSFLSALEFLKKELDHLNDGHGVIHEFKADGNEKSFEWDSPFSWDIKEGMLTQIEPINEILCDFSITQTSICTHSKPVDISAEVIHVGEGREEDLESKDVKGKIVLTSGEPRTMIEVLAKYGVIGAIIYPSEIRASGHLNMIRYVGIWPNSQNIELSSFGFSISRLQALKMIKTLEAGKKIIVHAFIDANLYKGAMHVLSTKIEGEQKNDKELVLVAHSCHPAPSANDNASGSALLLELYRVLKTLIDEHKIKRPDITLRFLWVPEFHGTVAWIKQVVENEQFQVIGCVNLDMVGEDPCLVGYPFTVSLSSSSTPSSLNDVITDILDDVKNDYSLIEETGWQFPWNTRINPFSGGSDHILFNDYPLRTPSVMFGHGDTFHHTNLDSIDKVDSTTLKRVGMLSALSVLVFSSPNLFHNKIVKAYLKGYFARKSKLFELLNNVITDGKYTNSRFLTPTILDVFSQSELVIMKSVFKNQQNNVMLKLIKEDLSNFKNESVKFLTEAKIEGNISSELKIVYKRNYKGPTNVMKLMKAYFTYSQGLTIKTDVESKQFLNLLTKNYEGLLHEISNLIDGSRTIAEILAMLLLSTSKPISKEIVCELLNEMLKSDLLTI